MSGASVSLGEARRGGQIDEQRRGGVGGGQIEVAQELEMGEHLVLAREVEQIVHDGFAARGLTKDHVQILLLLDVVDGGLLAQDVGIEEYRTQWVVDLVRHAGRKLAHGGQLLLLQ